MKKLIPLLVIAAGAVAYGVYKNRKEAEQSEEEKTLVVIDDTPSDNTPSEPVEEFTKEAVEEVQEELGMFETLSDSDEPFERPSFFHITEDSFLESDEPAVDIQPEIEEVFLETPTEPEKEIVAVEEAFDGDDKDSVPFEEGIEAVEESLEAIEPEDSTLESKDALEEPELLILSDEVLDENELVEVVAEEEPETEVELETADESAAEAESINDDHVENLIEEIAGQIEEAEDFFEEKSDEAEPEEAELEPLQSYNTPEVDELIKEIAGQVKAADQASSEEQSIEEESSEEAIETPASEDSDYLQDIRKITELYSEKVAQYNIRYPYLSSRFIDDTLKFSHQFNADYPVGTRVAIEHHAHFNAIEDLFVFAQIIRQSGYAVREGAEDKTLVVVREMFVDNNTILHDVFKVANQVYCLSGEYQKFRITKR